jgi:NAD-dependent SIR2 family protein deacetylase
VPSTSVSSITTNGIQKGDQEETEYQNEIEIPITSETHNNDNPSTPASHENSRDLSGSDFQSPRELLSHLVPNVDLSKIPPSFDDFDICRLVYQIMSSNNRNHHTTTIDFDSLELPTDLTALNSASAISSLFLQPREKLLNLNTIEQCVDLIHQSKNIIVLTGAGCSVSCGIPDFRSRDGIYARLKLDYPDLPDPQSMFDINYFEHDPRPFFKFAKEIYPGQFRPSISHMFVKKLEDHGKLLRNYTQNIDTLEQVAKIQNVIQCHGSFNTATCTSCKYQVNSEYIKERIFNQEIPYCDRCVSNQNSVAVDSNSAESTETGLPSAGILKPDIVFFGEGLPEQYHNSINDDKNKCDLLIVIGSSLKVKPVANIPHMLPKNIPQILINRESLKHMNFDVELLGDCDVIIQELLLRLEAKKQNEIDALWSDICLVKSQLEKIENEEAEQIVFHNYNNNNPNTSVASENSSIMDDSFSLLNNTKILTRDYLKENSFFYLRPSVYVFHGAELSLRFAKKKLRRLRKKYNMYQKSINGNDFIDLNINEDENSNDDTNQAKNENQANNNPETSENNQESSSNAVVNKKKSFLGDIYKDLEDEDDSDDSFSGDFDDSEDEEDDFDEEDDSDEDEKEDETGEDQHEDLSAEQDKTEPTIN